MMIRPWPVRESVRTLAVLRVGVALLICADTAASWRYSIELYSRSGPAMPYFAAAPTSTFSQQVAAAAAARTSRPATPVAAGEERNAPAGDGRKQPGPLDGSATPGPRAPAARLAPQGSLGEPWQAPWWPVPPAGVAVAAQSLLLFAGLSLACGWQTGGSLLLCGGLLAWLRPLDLSWTLAKPTVLWWHMLLLLGLGDCGAALRLVRPAQAEPAAVGSGLARWLLRLLACQVYAGAALTKLQSAWFTSGELLQYALLDRQYGGTSWGRWLAATPGVVRPLSLATLLFEILFPVLVWVPQCRRGGLLAAVLFHLGVGVCLHVALFSPTMLVLLLAFIEPREWHWLAERCGRWRCALWQSGLVAKPEAEERQAAPAWHASWSSGGRGLVRWAACGVAAMALGVGVQWGTDWYGVFGRQPRPPLVETTRAVLGELTRQVEPPADWPVHRVALGTRLSNTAVSGDPQRARRGESVYVRVQYSVPHRPLRLEGLLLSDEGQELARFEHEVRDEVSYSLDGFALGDELPPGGGRVLLLIDGEELTSRPIRWDP